MEERAVTVPVLFLIVDDSVPARNLLDKTIDPDQFQAAVLSPEALEQRGVGAAYGIGISDHQVMNFTFVLDAELGRSHGIRAFHPETCVGREASYRHFMAGSPPPSASTRSST